MPDVGLLVRFYVSLGARPPYCYHYARPVPVARVSQHIISRHCQKHSNFQSYYCYQKAPKFRGNLLLLIFRNQEVQFVLCQAHADGAEALTDKHDCSQSVELLGLSILRQRLLYNFVDEDHIEAEKQARQEIKDEDIWKT